MNKTAVLLLGVLGAASTTLAQGPVYSVNIVGIQKVPVTNMFTQISNPFIKTSQNINEVIGDQLTGGTDFESGDNLLFWNGSGYTRYFLASVPGNPLDGKWVDEGLSESTETIGPGKGAWVVLKGGVTNTLALVGDVVSTPTQSKTLNPGFNLVSYPYSASVALNSTAANLNKAAGCLGGTDFESSDVIFVWNGSGYSRYFLADVPGNPLDDKWVDEGLNEVTITLDPGMGFWYFRKTGSTGFDWVTTKPY